MRIARILAILLLSAVLLPKNVAFAAGVPATLCPETVYDGAEDGFRQPPLALPLSAIADKFKSGYVEGGVVFDPRKCPLFEITGFPECKKNGLYYRLPLSDAEQFSPGVRSNAWSSSGGRIRFRTDSTSMTIRVSLDDSIELSRMTKLGIAGVDIYTGSGSGQQHLGAVYPQGNGRVYSEWIPLSGELTDYTLMLPLYSAVSSITISLDRDAVLGGPTPYTYEEPIVFYGSSITQGCAASRPGTSYPQIVTRMLDANPLNLGFDASARGEQAVAEFIAGLSMSALVVEYDYNAVSAEELEKTHYNFYKTIREAQPELPILLLSRFDVEISEEGEEAQRRAVIRETYERALEQGDENIYFLDGQYVYPETGRDLCMVDGIHPNDLGMNYIAQAIYPVLKQALEKQS